MTRTTVRSMPLVLGGQSDVCFRDEASQVSVSVTKRRKQAALGGSVRSVRGARGVRIVRGARGVRSEVCHDAG